MFQGTLEGIFIGRTKAAPLELVESARAIAGQGLEGDRYCSGNGSFSSYKATGKDAEHHPQDKQVTLIEAEAIEAAAADYEVTIGPAQSRRNLLVRGVPLNHLVGKEFLVGEVRLRGLRLCEPCGHLEKLTVSGIKTALLHRGGLRAEILGNGVLRTGDAVRSISG
jgi:MOSC domain-containing protein YiiM